MEQQQTEAEKMAQRLEELTRHLLAKKTTTPRFRISLPTAQVQFILTAAYKAEVISRHQQPVLTDEVKANIKTMAMALTAEKPKFGIVLCGECGNGKTTMHYALQRVINFLRDDHYLFEKSYKDVKVGLTIVDAKELEVMSRTGKGFSELSNKFMVGVEDVGNEAAVVKDYGNERNPFVDLLEHRYNKQLFTSITTNLPPKKFREIYGVRVSDRLNEMMEIITFNDPSFRGKAKSS